VLDTGLRANDVLCVPPLADDNDWRTWQNHDAFVTVDAHIQKMIGDVCRGLVASGEKVEVLENPKDMPSSSAPLVGELDTHTGHGTFIAGIVQQIAPNAQVLAIRVMSGDGGVAESVLVPALHALAERVDRAIREGDETRMVDVVSLSLGYHPEEKDEDKAALSPLADAIDRLRGLGVVVVAAVGNSATSLRFAPASYADRKQEDGAPPVISVGALNPNRSKALFSNDGEWVTCWAPGAGVVSTFPQDINASRNASIIVNGSAPGDPPRETFDSDDYRAGHAVWLGSSFAAPHVAAQIAQVLMDHSEKMRPVSEQDFGAEKTRCRERAAKAVDAVQAQAVNSWDAR
jgi:subtilisin family serine protease